MAYLELDFRSVYTNSHQELCVILPDKCAKEKYPVLWLFHGANHDCTEWMRYTSIERYANKYGLAVIMPSIYNGYGMDMEHGAAYYSMISKELPEVVRYLLPCLSTKREDNFVAGASMGGYIAYKWALNSPEMFAKAGGFSSAHDIVEIAKAFIAAAGQRGNYFAHAFGSAEKLENTNNDLVYMIKENLKNGVDMPKFWSLCGRQDFGFNQCKGAMEKFKAAGMDITWVEDEGEHGYDLWDGYIMPFFDWLGLKKEGK